MNELLTDQQKKSLEFMRIFIENNPVASIIAVDSDTSPAVLPARNVMIDGQAKNVIYISRLLLQSFSFFSGGDGKQLSEIYGVPVRY